MQDRASRRLWGVLGLCALLAGCGEARESTTVDTGTAKSSPDSAAQPGGDETRAAAPGEPSSPGDAPAQAAADQERVTAAGLSFVPDPGWIRSAARGMRAAQFVLPGGDGGAQDAELVLFFFGVGGGGSVADNIDRWCGQFVQADGSNSRDAARVETRNVEDLKLTVVSVSGEYAAAPMPGLAPTKIEGEATMLAAIVEGEGGPWFFKALGPRPTIDRWQASVDAMLASLRLVRRQAAMKNPPDGV